MKVLLVSATSLEIAPILDLKASNFPGIATLITGVGMLAAGVQISRALSLSRPELIIQAGIAGCFDLNLPLATSVVVDKELIGDLGVMENEQWYDLFDLKLQEANSAPFIQKALINPLIQKLNPLNLPVVSGVTVNEITTHNTRIQQIRQKYNPTTESMEGAALHYAAIAAGIPFLQVRTVSNYTGERDKSKWALKESIVELNKTVAGLLQAFHDVSTPL